MASKTSRAWFIVPAIVLLLAGLTVISLRTGPTLSAPFSGSNSARVTLSIPEGDASGVVRQLVARLVLLGVNTTVAETRERGAVLVLKYVDDPQAAIVSAVHSEPVQVRPILDARPWLPPGSPELELPVAPGGEKLPLPFLVAPTRAEVRQGLESRAVPPGVDVGLECIGAPGGDKGGMCAAWLLGPERLDSRHIVDSTISSHRRTEEPLVTFKVDPEGQRALEELTQKNLDHQAAIIALGEIRARPLIAEPSRGDAWTFSTRTGDTNRHQSVERAELISPAARLPILPRVLVEKVEPVQ